MSFFTLMSATPFRLIDLGNKKKKEQLRDDVNFMSEYNDFPATWERYGKVVKLATATKQQLWDSFIEIMPSHSEKARQRFKD